MEVLILVGLVVVGVAAVALALQASFWVLAFVVLPLLWLWMLIDAIVRDAEDYPTKTTNEKILWIVLMLVLQVSAAVYWFLVYRGARERAVATPATAPPSVP